MCRQLLSGIDPKRNVGRFVCLHHSVPILQLLELDALYTNKRKQQAAIHAAAKAALAEAEAKS